MAFRFCAVLVALFAMLVLAAVPMVTEARNPCSNLLWRYPVNHGTITVKKGTTCSWVWGDQLQHCVNGHHGKFPKGFKSPNKIGKGSKYHYKFKTKGKFFYNCCLHGNTMQGYIHVV